jgi:hypothetical protein
MQAAAPPQEPAAPPQLSQEDRDKVLKRVHATADVLTSIGITDPTPEQVEAAQNLFDGIAQHAYTMAEARTRLLQNDITQQVTPLNEMAMQYQRERAEQVFYTEYPALKEFPVAVQEAAKRVEPNDAAGVAKTDAQLVQEVAQVAEQFIKQFNPNFNLSTATPSAPGTSSAPAAVPAMAAGITGGRSQGGASSGGADNNPDADIYS